MGRNVLGERIETRDSQRESIGLIRGANGAVLGERDQLDVGHSAENRTRRIYFRERSNIDFGGKGMAHGHGQIDGAFFGIPPGGLLLDTLARQSSCQRRGCQQKPVAI